MEPIQFDEIGQVLPDGRAAIIGEMVRFVAALSQPTSYSALFSHLLSRFGAAEEHIGGEIHLAFGLLALAGVIVSNDTDAKSGNATISAGTTVGPSKTLTSYVWLGAEDLDEGEGA